MRNRSNHSVAQLRDDLKRLLKKKHGDDWEEAWKDMSAYVKVGCRKQPLLDEIDELENELYPEYREDAVKSELESEVVKARNKTGEMTAAMHRERERAEAAENQLKAVTEDRDKWQREYTKKEVENRSLKRPLDEQAMVDELERKDKQIKELERKSGHHKDLITAFNEKCNENKKLKAQVESKSGPGAELLREKEKELREKDNEVNEVKKKLGEVKEELDKALEENKQLTEQIAHKEALGPKPSDETEALKAKIARLEEKLADALLNNKVREFMSEFKSELMDIETELGILGLGGKVDFSKVFGVKAWHEDYNDETFAYVTLNARRILEKVLCDTMLYDRMQAFMGVDPDRRVHHKPRADQTERNAHTIEVCKRIWGVGFNPDSLYNIVGN